MNSFISGEGVFSGWFINYLLGLINSFYEWLRFFIIIIQKWAAFHFVSYINFRALLKGRNYSLPFSIVVHKCHLNWRNLFCREKKTLLWHWAFPPLSFPQCPIFFFFFMSKFSSPFTSLFNTLHFGLCPITPLNLLKVPVLLNSVGSSYSSSYLTAK